MAAQRIRVRAAVFVLELLPVVLDVNQLSRDVVGTFRGEEQGELNLLIGRDAAGEPHMFGDLDLVGAGARDWAVAKS